jgi:hypothetical protein
MSRPILLVCGCRKYEEYLHAAIRRFDHPEYEVIGFLGGDKESFDPVTRILTLPTPDTYETLPTKLHAAFTWIQKFRPGTPGVFKTDDDMMFDMDAMVTTIIANTTIPYWGITASVCKAATISPERILNRFENTSLRPSHQTAAYSFGAGYWVSKDALPLIVAAAADYKASVLEDVCTGFVMNRAGIMPHRIRFPYKEVPRNPELLAQK